MNESAKFKFNEAWMRLTFVGTDSKSLATSPNHPMSWFSVILVTVRRVNRVELNEATIVKG